MGTEGAGYLSRDVDRRRKEGDVVAEHFSTRPNTTSQAVRIGNETVTRWSGKLREMLGAARNDDKLRVQGRLQQEEADTRRKARLAEADAAQRRRQADIRERQDEAQVAERRAELDGATTRAEAGAVAQHAREEARADRAERAADELKRRADAVGRS